MSKFNAGRTLPILGASALVVSNDAPGAVKTAASLAAVVFGARIQVCDGVADDVQGNAVIDEITDGEIRFSAGTFTFTATLNMDRKSISLVGAGKHDTTFTLASGVNADVILDGDGSATHNAGRIAHLGIDGDSANQTAGSGIHLRSALGMLIDDVYIADCADHGVYLENPSGSIYPAVTELRFCYISSNDGDGVYIYSPTSLVEGVKITDCLLGDNGTDTGTHKYNLYAEASNLVVSGCSIWQPCGGVGASATAGVNICLHGCAHTTIEGNRILSAAEENILVTSPSTGRPSHIITINGNSFHSANEAGGSDYHIQLGASATSVCYAVNIDGNVFSQPSTYACPGIVNEHASSHRNFYGVNTVSWDVATNPVVNMTGLGSRSVVEVVAGPSDAKLAVLAPYYELVLAILGDTGTILPIGDRHFGASSATTFTTLRRTSSGITATFTWSGAPNGWTTDFEVDDPTCWKGIIPFYDFDGSTDEADTPDADYWSRGDGSADSAFSVGAWIYWEGSGSERILAKTGASEEEWIFGIESGGYPVLHVHDDDKGVTPKRQADAALSTDTWYFVVITYDGTGGATAMTGATVYVNGLAVASTATENASYVAMENGDNVVCLAHEDAAAGDTSFFTGRIAGGPLGPFYVQAELDADQVARLYAIGRRALGV